MKLSASWDFVQVVFNLRRIKREENEQEERATTITHFLVKWQGYEELTWEPTGNLHPRAIRNFLLEVSRDVAESRRKLVGERVLKSNESNSATCIGVCRCGRFEGKFHAIVRQYDDAQSVSRSKKKKKKKRSYCLTYRTECVHFDSLISLSSTTSSKMMCVTC